MLYRHEPEGDDFQMFGIMFDTQLGMEQHIDSLTNRCRWKLKTLLRARKYFTEEQMVQQYKTHILPYLEFATPAVYHATATALDRMNKLQTNFLKELGLTPLKALQKYKLAPLSTRRDIALLGVLHRIVLGEGPPQFARWFYPAQLPAHSYETRLQEAKRKHGKQLHDYLDENQTALLRRSPLGLPRVYNELEPKTVACKTVRGFQKALQAQVLKEAEGGNEEWEHCLKVKPSLR